MSVAPDRSSAIRRKFSASRRRAQAQSSTSNECYPETAPPLGSVVELWNDISNRENGMSTVRNLFAAAILFASAVAAQAAPQWLTLPPTPILPKAVQSGFAPVNGIRIWYASFGRGEPVVMLHGGLANSHNWDHQ